MKKSNNNRNNQLAQIHIARAELGLDDDTYRSIIRMMSNGRTDSSAELDYAERRKLLEHFEARGWKNKPAKNAKTRPLATDDQSKMIRGLWIELFNLGAIANSSEAALAAFVKRQTGVNALQWLNSYQASQVIESLKKWVIRVERNLRNQESA